MNLSSRTIALSVLAVVALAAPALAEPAAKAAKKKPPIYDTEINGFLELQSKADISGKSERKMLVNFGTNDCDPCRVVAEALAERKFFEAMTKQFVPVSIDVSEGSKNRQLLTNFSLDAKEGLPILAIFDSNGKFLEATTHGEMVKAAKKGPDEVRAWILARFKKDEP